MSEQRSPNSKSRVFDDLRNSLFFSRVSISIEVSRDVSDRLDEIIDELCDCLSDEMREDLTREKLCEMCLMALVDEYKNNQSDSFFVRAIENLCQPRKSESEIDSSK